MKIIILVTLILFVHISYAQTTLEIIDKTNDPTTKFKVSHITNPYSGSQVLIEKGFLASSTKIVYQPQYDLEKLFLEIEGQTYSFYVEPNGSYQLTITSLDSIVFSLNEKNSSINKALKEVDKQFESVTKLKSYFDGTREGSLEWLHLGRDKKGLKRSIAIINKNIKSIMKEDWYNEYNNAYNIDLYLAPYILVEDFKNDNLSGNLARVEKIFQNVEENITNPIFAESFKFFYGYSLRQNFKLNGQGIETTNSYSYAAFKKAIEVIAELNNDTTRQLALLSAYESYYHSFYFYFEKKAMIEHGLEVILKNPKNLVIKEFAISIKNKLRTLTIGEKVPDFELVSYTGDSISLSDLKGKYVYLDFWFSRCPPCIDALRDLPSIVDQYQDKVYFVSINGFDSFELGKKLAEENGFIGFKLHAGKNHQILSDYNIQWYPTYYLISPEGKLLYKPVNYYRYELDNVLKYLK